MAGARNSLFKFCVEILEIFENFDQFLLIFVWCVRGEKMAKTGGKNLPDTVAFSDSDFMGCFVTLKSTSGSIMYYKGVPIIWSSKRQSIRARSPTEAEYVGI